MSKPKQMCSGWEVLTGRDRARSGRAVRVLQLGKKGDLGVQGKAADNTPAGCAWFLLADTSGDTISEAAERATLWGGLVRDRSSIVAAPARTELDKAFRAWKASVDGGSVEPAAVEDILPCADLHGGIAALFQRMSDPTKNVRDRSRLISFAELVSSLSLKIELRIGGNEGPQAVVYCHNRRDRYISRSSLPERMRKARYPVYSVVTIEYAHLFFFARLLAGTADTQSAVPSPAAPTAPTSSYENAALAGAASTRVDDVLPPEATPQLAYVPAIPITDQDCNSAAFDPDKGKREQRSAQALLSCSPVGPLNF